MSARKQAAHARGVAAEAQCAAYLQKKGYDILGMRVRTAGGELDIVARQGDVLAIVEVKARRVKQDGLFAVTPAKQARIARATEALLADPAKIGGLAAGFPPNIRFDVMAVGAYGAPLHIEDAWRLHEAFF